MKYEIHFRPHNQDVLTIREFCEADKSAPNYREILAYSRRSGNLKKGEKPRTFVCGSDHIGPYFSANTPDIEAAHHLDFWGKKLRPGVFTYKAF